ncbi:MAG TPA: sigma factor-like helix-turn-helix DNA-binding protein [Candidatus Paceibacterota bacterium]|nr:sigma factor-like helix-turn-helix DNA-binding protein [Candidatus Paceibacterota bacterium]
MKKTQEEINEIKKYLSRVTPREQDILIKRYGLNGEKPMTLALIGQKYNISRERVRQIEARAIKKIKWSKNNEQKTMETDNFSEKQNPYELDEIDEEEKFPEGVSEEEFEETIQKVEEGENISGLIDEVRISSVARSADWIKATYQKVEEGENISPEKEG